MLVDDKLRAFYDHFGFQKFKSEWKILLCPNSLQLAAKTKLEEDVRSFIYGNNHLINLQQRMDKENIPRQFWRPKFRRSQICRRDLEVEVEVDLASIYQEKAQTFHFERHLMEPFTERLVTARVSKKVILGYYVLECPTIRFEGEGHQYFQNCNSDLLVKFRVKPAESFKRKELDLIFTKKISLKEALTENNFTMTHLDGSCIDISTIGVISPQTVVKIPQKGFFSDYNRYKHFKSMKESENQSNGFTQSKLGEKTFQAQNSESALNEAPNESQEQKRIVSAIPFLGQRSVELKASQMRHSRTNKNIRIKVNAEPNESRRKWFEDENQICDFYINFSNISKSISTSVYNSGLIDIMNKDYCNPYEFHQSVRGDLYVVFEIRFPKVIDANKLAQISSILNR